MGVTDVVGVYRVGMECVVLVDHSQQDGVADCDGGADYKSPTGMGGVFCCRTIFIRSERWICMADLYGDVYQSFVTTVDQRDGDDLDTVNGVIHWNRSAVWSSDERLFAAAIEVLPTSGYAWHLQGLSQIQSGDFVAGFQSFKMASSKGHIHHQSAEFAIRSALKAGWRPEAFEFAEAGPKVGLSRGYLEAWLRCTSC